MALRDCKHCWKTVEDEEHYWFCPFGSGVRPHGPKKSQRGADNGGGGGGEPGEGNIPPLPDAPSGGGATIDIGQLRTIPKPAMIENQPALALPAPLGVKDEQKLRCDRLGEHGTSSDLV